MDISRTISFLLGLYPRIFKTSASVSGIHAYLLSVFDGNVGITVLRKYRRKASRNSEVFYGSVSPYNQKIRKC